MADSKAKPAAAAVLLCLAAHEAALDGKDKRPLAHAEIDLKRGAVVQVVDGSGHPLGAAVTYDGDPLAFVNALSYECRPVGVRTRSREVERTVTLDGESVTAKVTEHTCFLVDG